jgi:excisionase family DNA binding protein
MVETDRSEMATKYYSIREVAAMLGISRPYVYYLQATRKLKAQKVGAQWIIPAKEVERLKRERTGESND